MWVFKLKYQVQKGKQKPDWHNGSYLTSSESRTGTDPAVESQISVTSRTEDVRTKITNLLRLPLILYPRCVKQLDPRYLIIKSGFGREITRVGHEIRSPRDISTRPNVLSTRPPISWSYLVSNIWHVGHEIPWLQLFFHFVHHFLTFPQFENEKKQKSDEQSEKKVVTVYTNEKRM